MGWRDIKFWFYGKSKLEKVLLCFVLVLVIVTIVLFVCLLISRDNELCTSPECIRASVHLLDTVNPEADPCNDFYAFACGNFMKNAFSTGQPTTLHALDELTKNQLKKIVVEDSKNSSGLPRTVVFQRTFYQTCMDTASIERHGDERLFNLFDEVIGGWPILKINSWPEKNFNWIKSIISARKLGLYHQFFFRVDIYQNFTANKSILWIRPPSENEINSFYFNDTNVEIMENIARELGGSSVDIKAEFRITNTFAEQLRHFAQKRNNETLEYDDDRRVNISIKDINHRLIKFDWLNFLSELTGIHLTNEERVVFDVEDYLSDLYYLFHRTPKKIQANYIAWIILSTNMIYLPKKIRNRYNEITNLSEEKEGSKRNEQCYKLSLGLFNNVAESEYIRRYTTPEKKNKIQHMIKYIKDEMETAIETAQWIDDTSRSNALKRLQNVTTYIGWLDLAFNETKLEELSGFNKVKHFPENGPAIYIARIALKAKNDKMYSQIRTRLSELERLSVPRVEINAYYVRTYNLLILPAPILQGLIFDLHRPYYMNYGALGSVIGHELTHGFSIIHEKDENESISELWTTNTLEKRGEIAECIQKEYTNFQTDHGEETTNATSIEEDVADFNGVNIAYKAYRRWVRVYGVESALPGIKFTPNQIFWIMASTFMCYEPQLSEKDTVLGKDKLHGIPEFRVVGRIRNSPYFAHDFNCPVGSKMNPMEKCRIFL